MKGELLDLQMQVKRCLYSPRSYQNQQRQEANGKGHEAELGNVLARRWQE